MKLFIAVSLLLAAAVVNARCPNACSKHGLCGTNSQCNCYRNWMGSDCSERVCYFAHAFIDTPLGDLNADGNVDMQVVIDEKTKSYALEGYPINYGKAREVTLHLDTDSTGAEGSQKQGDRWDEAHFYRECANKGICNRKTGQCECFPGYEGEGCQRTSCPGSSAGLTCSGHGLCRSAYHDKSRVEYNLWDAWKTMACQCDSGYSGPDCSLRNCPVGPDPVEHNDRVTTSLQKIAWGAFMGKSASFGGKNEGNNRIRGDVLFTITVTDDYGDQWTTNSLTVIYQSVTGTSGTTYMFPTSDNFNAELKIREKNTDVGDFGAGLGLASTQNFYRTGLLADTVNASLHALPNGAVRDVNVWTEYTLPKAFTQVTPSNADDAYDVAGSPVRTKYPSTQRAKRSTVTGLARTDEGYTTAWISAKTRFPDFGTAQDAKFKRSCGANGKWAQKLQHGASASSDLDTYEGLCIFISSANKITSNYFVTYTFNSLVGASKNDYSGVQMKGTSCDDYDGWSAGYQGLNTSMCEEYKGLVKVSEVGKYRSWDNVKDGRPPKVYGRVNLQAGKAVTDPDAYLSVDDIFGSNQCSKRGLCHYETGECSCFAGYTGIACSRQNAISFSG